MSSESGVEAEACRVESAEVMYRWSWRCGRIKRWRMDGSNNDVVTLG